MNAQIPSAQQAHFSDPAHLLHPRCDLCVALCCVAPDFTAEQGFAFDKAAHTPCRNLSKNCQCAIHPQLVARGFPGCVSFDCFGAGQRVVAMFGGRSWQPDAASPAAAELFAAYRIMRDLHELLMLLAQAHKRFANHPETLVQAALRFADINRLCELPIAEFLSLSVATLRRDTQLWLQSLRALV